METKLKLEFSLPPCPRNRSHTITYKKQGKHIIPMNIKTEAARAYEAALKEDLYHFVFQIMEFKAAFNKDKHFLRCLCKITDPKLFTATGKINSQCPDWDAHKIMWDVICDYMQIDDTYIRTIGIIHRCGDEYKTEVEFQIADLNDIEVDI